MLVVLILILASFWTQVLWFRQVGYSSVYRTELVTRSLLFLLGLIVMAGGVFASLYLGYRSRPIYAPAPSGPQASLERYRETIEPLRRLLLIVVPVILGLFGGSAVAQNWQTVLLWLHRQPFGSNDVQFGLDIGFFVFTLPLLEFVVGFLTATVFLSAIAAVVTHYLYGGMRLQGGGVRFTATARAHLCILAAMFLFLRAVDYWLGRYALTTKDSSRITGLTYTDANVVVTSKGILAAIAFMIGVLFIVAAFTDRWRFLPLYGVGLLLVSGILIGGVLPALVQRFQVVPNLQAKESPYIQRNIDATRTAYGLQDIKVTPYQAKTNASPGALHRDASTVPGIRLLDPALVSPTFRQVQQNKQYYGFPDNLDVDRYALPDGDDPTKKVTHDTVISVRDLDLAGVSNRSWVTDHLVYTHGFGVVAAYGNKATSSGYPSFFQSGIPSVGKLGEYEPRIYFGESSPDYSIVGGPEGAAPVELDYPDDESASNQVNTTFKGDGGVSLGSFWNRLLYAIKFRDQNILLSDSVNAKSQILYDRVPRDRVQKVAPFLTLDGDPYPVVVDGRVKWVIDGYTTSSKYPYSRTTILEDATSDSVTATSTSVEALPRQRVNYMRNSVKATVDAYDGKVTLYTWDDQDPILKAWSGVFPGALQPMSKISGDLMSHLRYPEDIFKVQRIMLQRYHVTDAQGFFNTQDFWELPQDPTPLVNQATVNQMQPPYYVSLRMPDQESPTFSLTSTYIPDGGQRNVLTGFLAVDADAGNEAGKRREDYGKLRLLQLPRDSSVPAPGQVQNNFNSDTDVSTQLNLLRGGNSTLRFGNLLTLPVAGNLLYVQPVYVSGSGSGRFYQMRQVLVAFGDGATIGYAPTLNEALDQVFGGDSGADAPDAGVIPDVSPTAPPTSPSTGGGTSPTSPSTSGTPSPSPSGTGSQAELNRALADAAQAMRESSQALAKGDFTAYGQAQDRLKEALERAIAANADGSN